MKMETNLSNNNRVLFLQQRKKQLEILLIEKNEVLRKLCLQEGELTGILPSEIPIDDNSGCSINSNEANNIQGNTLRRKVETGFTLSESLLSNNCNEADEINKLLLEKEVQASISEAALYMANNFGTNKVVRRKHRHMYKQSQQKLSEINKKINNKVQNQATICDLEMLPMKHGDRLSDGNIENYPRIPTPPKHYTTTDHMNKPVYNLNGYHNITYDNQNDGIKRTSSIKTRRVKTDSYPDNHLQKNSWYSNSPLLSSTLSSSQSMKSIVYSHLPRSPIIKRALPNAQAFSHKKISHTDLKESDSEHGSSVTQNVHDHRIHDVHSLNQQRFYIEQPNELHSTIDLNNYTNEEQFANPEQFVNGLDQRSKIYMPNYAQYYCEQVERFGSLDRRKASNVSPLMVTNTGQCKPKIQIRSHSIGELTITEDIYDTVSIGSNNSIRSKEKHWFETSLDEQTSTSVKPSVDLILNTKHTHIQDKSHHSLPLYTTASIKQSAQKDCNVLQTDNLYRNNNISVQSYNRNNEKGIYSIAPHHSHNIYSDLKHSHNFQYENMHYSMNKQRSAQPGVTNMEKRLSPRLVPQQQHDIQLSSRNQLFHDVSNGSGCHNFIVKSIPVFNETLISNPQLVNNEQQYLLSMQLAVPLESPKNLEIVSPGKWVPYKEITKPFEMSDFYKYSTKFRNKNHNIVNEVTSEYKYENKIDSLGNAENFIENSGIDNESGLNLIENSIQSNLEHIQKGVYQPLKPMTCQPMVNKSKNHQLPKSNATLV